MDEQDIGEALARVREMQAVVLERRRFRGFSGLARGAGGVVTLLAAGLLSRTALIPPTPTAHLIGWGCVLIAGLLLNYGALLVWTWRQATRQGWSVALPALDAFPALIVGAALSFALVRIEAQDLLFGTWMTVYGLVHVAYRRNLPPGIYLLGLAYIACGVFCLAWQGISFIDPWPMGLVFGFGEAIGGMILYGNGHSYENNTSNQQSR
ncbi:MAG: hypothetical protein PHR35_22655 [Kiritimatiellae bacterium]|nr:hypothetical protein [Kiritimatiellia bacterium]